jgi:hypothetical protein
MLSLPCRQAGGVEGGLYEIHGYSLKKFFYAGIIKSKNYFLYLLTF